MSPTAPEGAGTPAGVEAKSRHDGPQITGGVDTYGLTHHAAVIDPIGRHLADREFPATIRGYRDLLDWMRSDGTLVVGRGRGGGHRHRPAVRTRGYLTFGSPIGFSGFTPVITGSPLLGEHTDEVLAELGYEADAIAKMHANHVVV
ncbi:hypothetical protein [Actinacidiphila oryziradicis]|uniref:hypothetical protein n=1 Tax=Actinacidiphila oryziradicis TaxID=2571141 RepID=UPI001B803815|nr:hypothetical protein [Actinacidiphila oryziradicis]